MKQIIKTLFIVLFFSSCEGNYEDITDLIKDNSNTPKYIIEGQITDHPFRHHIVITKPSSIKHMNTFEGVSNATVTVSDGTNTWSFTELPATSLKYKDLSYNRLTSGVYENDEYFAGFQNRTYTLNVTINGTTYSAQETMPVANEATTAEIAILRNTTNIHIFGRDHSAIWNASRESKEGIEILLDGTINFHNRIETEGVHGDTDGLVEPGFIFPSLSTSKQELAKYSVTNGFSNFIWGFFAETTWQGTIFSAESSKLHSNFNNPEVAGYFSVVSSSFYEGESDATMTLQNYKIFETQKSYRTNYDTQGEFTVNFSKTGQCIMQGFGQTMVGAYEILNNEWVTMFFPRSSYTVANNQLYRFYYENIIGAVGNTEIPPQYFGGYPGFRYVNDNTLQSLGDKIWELL